MTEEGARSKVCPRTLGPSKSIERYGFLSPNEMCGNCIASDCMAWICSENYKDVYFSTKAKLTRLGYCGLARKVQPYE